MSQSETITASGATYNITASNELIYITGSGGGAVSITGSQDTVIGAANGIDLLLSGGNNTASISAADVTLRAAGGSGDSISMSGANSVINDSGAINTGVLLVSGANDTVTSTSQVEKANVTITASYAYFNSMYLTGNVVIAGKGDTVVAGEGNFTVSGAKDLLKSFRAESVDISGASDSVQIAAIPGFFGTNVSVLEGFKAITTVPGSFISVTGANAYLQTAVDNTTVISSGANAALDLDSYNNSVSASGASSAVTTQSNNEAVTVAGGNSTVTTNMSGLGLSSPTLTASQPTTTIVVSSTAGGTTYDDNATNEASVTASTPVTVNLNVAQNTSSVSSSSVSGSTSTVLPANVITNDLVGGNVFSINGASQLNASAGADTIYVVSGSNIETDTISGTASKPNVIELSSQTVFNTRVDGKVAQNNLINVSGDQNYVYLYAASQDTVSVGGAGNVIVLDKNDDTSFAPGGADTTTGTAGSTANVVDITGANALYLLYGGASVDASSGATVGSVVPIYNTTVSGGDNVQLSTLGDGNSIALTGNDTIKDGSYWQYSTDPFYTPAVQNQYTVQGGEAILGGLDQLLQTTGGALYLSLYGGDSVTLNGQNDTVVSGDQVYGGNLITNNAGSSTFSFHDVAGAADTLISSVSTDVVVTDDTGVRVGGTNNNTDQSLYFVGGLGASNTINAAASHTALIVNAASDLYDKIYGGMAGGNSINGGLGGYDLFVAGGSGDVLIGGSAGNNTLVSATGNETLVGAAASDVFSITGGGGVDVLKNFSGSLDLKAGLTVTEQTVTAGGLDIMLNDGTQVTLLGITNALHQSGNVYTLG